MGLEEVEPEEFEAVNALLREHGLPPHEEPVLDEDEMVEYDMGGYGPLHNLRRIAAHVQAGRPFPGPGDENAHEDPVLVEAYEWSTDQFAHLILHSDAEGYYVPVDFPSPVNGNVTGETLGSSVALRRELLELRLLAAAEASVARGAAIAFI